MASKLTESDIENLAIEVLQKLGYTPGNGDLISPPMDSIS
jgi:hypothetical protein